MQKPVLISSDAQHRGRVVTVYSDRVRFADGRQYDLDIIRHPGAAAIVPIDADGRTCLVRQYRHAVEDFMWEIPAGKLDAGESPAAAAVRELAEETGVSAERWDYMGVFLPSPGLISELVHLYMAQDLRSGASFPDSDEELEIQWLPLGEALRMVIDGRCSDGKTALGILRAHARLFGRALTGGQKS